VATYFVVVLNHLHWWWAGVVDVVVTGIVAFEMECPDGTVVVLVVTSLVVQR
jgi:hypothetical protein